MSVPRKKIFHFNVYNVNSQHYHKKGQNNTEYKYNFNITFDTNFLHR